MFNFEPLNLRNLSARLLQQPSSNLLPMSASHEGSELVGRTPASGWQQSHTTLLLSTQPTGDVLPSYRDSAYPTTATAAAHSTAEAHCAPAAAPEAGSSSAHPAAVEQCATRPSSALHRPTSTNWPPHTLDMQNRPITDPWAAVLLFAIVLSAFTVGLKSHTTGSLQWLYRGTDSTDLVCGVDTGRVNQPYVYWPEAPVRNGWVSQIDIRARVCVSRCFTAEDVENHVALDLPSEVAKLLSMGPTNATAVPVSPVYTTELYYSSYCVAVVGSPHRQGVLDYLKSSYNFRSIHAALLGTAKSLSAQWYWTVLACALAGITGAVYVLITPVISASTMTVAARVAPLPHLGLGVLSLWSSAMTVMSRNDSSSKFELAYRLALLAVGLYCMIKGAVLLYSALYAAETASLSWDLMDISSRCFWSQPGIALQPFLGALVIIVVYVLGVSSVAHTIAAGVRSPSEARRNDQYSVENTIAGVHHILPIVSSSGTADSSPVTLSSDDLWLDNGGSNDALTNYTIVEAASPKTKGYTAMENVTTANTVMCNRNHISRTLSATAAAVRGIRAVWYSKLQSVWGWLCILKCTLLVFATVLIVEFVMATVQMSIAFGVVEWYLKLKYIRRSGTSWRASMRNSVACCENTVLHYTLRYHCGTLAIGAFLLAGWRGFRILSFFVSKRLNRGINRTVPTTAHWTFRCILKVISYAAETDHFNNWAAYTECVLNPNGYFTCSRAAKENLCRAEASRSILAAIHGVTSVRSVAFSATATLTVGVLTYCASTKLAPLNDPTSISYIQYPILLSSTVSFGFSAVLWIFISTFDTVSECMLYCYLVDDIHRNSEPGNPSPFGCMRDWEVSVHNAENDWWWVEAVERTALARSRRVIVVLPESGNTAQPDGYHSDTNTATALAV
eukprot:Lankesteria_metandrocarpae@DN4734_c0_g1_i1.p1